MEEPVFVLRAGDQASVPTLDAYLALSASMGAPQEHLDGIQEARESFCAWQTEQSEPET